jgi:hypothetical protein
MAIGPHLLPLPDGASGFTTDASTKKILPAFGLNLAIYNKDTSVHAVTIGDSTVAAQAVGVVQAGTQFVGAACRPGDWTYLSMANFNWVVTDNNSLVVYLIDDDTSIKVEVK